MIRFLSHLLLIIITAHLSNFTPIAAATDTLYAGQPLIDGQTLISSGEIFELGFFSLTENTSHRYLGIWYKDLSPTYIWVANRNNPSIEGEASLVVTLNGSVSFENGLGSVWSVVPNKVVNGGFLQLLDSGNLVLIDNSSSSSGEEYLWESFDYMTDTLLPGAKVSRNIDTGSGRNLTSWSSSTDPSFGDYTYSLDQPETPQLVLRKGTRIVNRWGPWDGVRFSGSRTLRPNPVFVPFFNSTAHEASFSYNMVDVSLRARFVISIDGLIQYLSWRNDTQRWVNIITVQRDECDEYGKCGPYGSCYGGVEICKCLKGFRPLSPENWNSLDWTGGCTRDRELNCGNGTFSDGFVNSTFSDGFVEYRKLKLPDYARLGSNRSLSLKECEMKCLENCSCTAYTRIDIHGNGGDCVLWFGDLVDIKNYPDEGDVLYVRMARAELDAIADAKRRRLVGLILSITLPVISGVLCLGFACWYIVRKKRARGERLSYEQDLELPIFDMLTISSATRDFSSKNKIGQGGFGPVYVGVLPSGQEIAVKRLSINSGQGIDEFENEVKLIAKLQHRNLVKLLGCCIHEDERMLIYEYMPNKSLDYHLFDQSRGKLLSWKKRFDIIVGIARGLLYLHQDSRLRIIHRDLKPSNILLDNTMSPKISDFGIARIFYGEQTREVTKRVSGTYGYIAPEYALRGRISAKSDVFSFGVLVLEILSGKRIMTFSDAENDLNLLGYTWKLWNEGKPLDILDEKIEEPFSQNEVVRCIHVAMLCAQLLPEDRPMMHSVVVMLVNEHVEIPQPKEPGFRVESIFMGADSSSSVKDNVSSHHNDISITTLEGR